MTKKVTITVQPTSAPADLLATARSTLEGRGYLWEPTGPVTASAHEGGKPVTRRNLSSKLVVDLQVEGSRLIMVQRTTGAVGFLTNLGPLVAMRVSAEFTKVRKALETALT